MRPGSSIFTLEAADVEHGDGAEELCAELCAHSAHSLLTTLCRHVREQSLQRERRRLCSQI
eukprot:2283502-Rhodomonas_salina.1